MTEMSSQNLCEWRQARAIKRVPEGARALVGSGAEMRTLEPGGRLRGRMRSEAVFLFRPRFHLNFRDVFVWGAKKDGAENDRAWVCTLSIDCQVTNGSVLMQKAGNEAVASRQVVDSLRETVVSALSATRQRQRNLTKSQFWKTANTELLEELRQRRMGAEWGIEPVEVVLRRVITEKEHEGQKKAETQFGLKLKEIAADGKISEVAAAKRLEVALQEIETDKRKRLQDLVKPEREQGRSNLEVLNELLYLYGLGPMARRPRFPWGLLPIMLLMGIASVIGYQELLHPTPDTSVQQPPDIRWYAFGQRHEGHDWEQFQIFDGTTVQAGDQFRISFTPNHDCYAYILSFNADGSVSRLFPSPAVKQDHFCRGGEEYEVPDGVNWFTLDAAAGTDTLFLVANPDPMPELEALRTDISGPEVHRIDKIVRDKPSVVKRIQLRHLD